jgi:hypothetical protein
MTDYEIIPVPAPRSRLGRPNIANLARRLIHELQRHGMVLSARDRTQLAHLRSLVNGLLEDDQEVQVD